MIGATNMGKPNLKDALSSILEIIIFTAFFFQKNFFAVTQSQ